MTNATMNREFNPGRSPLLGLVAVAAAALTMGAMVLLPAQHTRSEVTVAAAPRVEVSAPVQVVTLPTVEVVGVQTTKTAAKKRWALPTAFKKG